MTGNPLSPSQTMDPDAAVIEMGNVSHRFPDGTLGLDAVGLAIRRGSFVVLAGRNGSGKTTLLRHLNGLLLPTSGAIRVAGLPVERHLRKVRQLVGMVFQDADSQIVGETVYDDVAFGPENLGLGQDAVAARVHEALDIVGLHRSARRQPHLLSSGEKRRLAIAGILAMKPEVIVFDEPFSNLDYPGLKQVLQRIVDLHRRGHTLIMATHELDPVMGHADRLLIMADGRIVGDGSPRELIDALEPNGVRAPRCLPKEAVTWRN